MPIRFTEQQSDAESIVPKELGGYLGTVLYTASTATELTLTTETNTNNYN